MYVYNVSMTTAEKKIRKTAVITTTLSSDLAKWLKVTAQKRLVTRREVLEDALRHFKLEVNKENLAASFRRASDDPEMAILAEAGISDWTGQLTSLEDR